MEWSGSAVATVGAVVCGWLVGWLPVGALFCFCIAVVLSFCHFVVVVYLAVANIDGFV